MRPAWGTESDVTFAESSWRFLALRTLLVVMTKFSVSTSPETVRRSIVATPVSSRSFSVERSCASSAANANGTGATRKRGEISSRPAGVTPTQNVSGRSTSSGVEAWMTKQPLTSVANRTLFVVKSEPDAFSVR